MGAAFIHIKNLGWAVLFACSVGSCTSDEPAAENAPVSALTEEEQVRNELVAESRDELKKWFRFYDLDAAADSLFQLRAIWDVSLLTFPVADNWQELYREHPKLFKPSPDETVVLDIFTYERNFYKKRRGKTEVTADSPDSEVAIVDPEKGEKLRLMFCGTPCQFHDAWWRSKQDVIVAGLVQTTDQHYHPTLWHINLNTNQIKQYTLTLSASPKRDSNYLIDEVFDEI